MRQELSATVGETIRVIELEGGTIPPDLLRAIDARGRIEDYRVHLDNQHAARLAAIGDQLVDAATRGHKADKVTTVVEDALTLAARQQLGDNGAWDNARRTLNAQLATALASATDDLLSEAIRIVAGHAVTLTALADLLPVDDLTDARAVIKVGGTAAGDAAAALDTLNHLDALLAGISQTLRGNWQHGDIVPRISQVLRICEPVDLTQAQDLAGAPNIAWAAARAGIPIRLATAAEYRATAERITEEWRIEQLKHPRVDAVV